MKGTTKPRKRLLGTWFLVLGIFPCGRYTQILSKTSAGHQRVAVHRKNPQKRAPWSPLVSGYKNTQVQSISWGSCRLGIRVSPNTERVLKNVLGGSKNPQVQSKPCFKLWLATKSSPGHERVEVHRYSSQNVISGTKTLPGTQKFAKEVIAWASACRCPLKSSPKTCSAGRQNLQVQSKPR